MQTVVTVEELNAFFVRDFPQCSARVEALPPGRARVRQAVGEEHLRPGGTISGPTMMAVADAAAYAAILGAIGIVPLAVTTNMSIAFLRRPRAGAALIGDARILKLGKTLVFLEVSVTSEGEDEPCAHATATYAIPPDRQKKV